MRHYATVLWLVAILAPASSTAQAVRVELVSPGSASPISGGIVALLDSTGAVVASGLTGEDGVQLLRAPRAGRYRLRVERIGYRSTLTQPIALTLHSTVSERVSLSEERITLPSVRVVADRRCVTRPADGLLTASLWTEARKALEATRLTAQQRSSAFRVRRTERELDPATLAPRLTRSWEKEVRTTAPFAAEDAALIAREGWVRRQGDGSTLYAAPDAALLLSDAFLDSHCFTVTPDSANRRIGLAFAPVSRQRKADIRGTLWLDAATLALRHIDFRYVNLELGVPTEQLGGRVEFEQLPSGQWIVGSWYIRTPVIATSPRTDALRETASSRSLVLQSLREEGGRLVRRAVPSALTSKYARLLGVAQDSLLGRPLTGVRVFLSGTSHIAVTDAEGRFVLDSILPGSYTLSFLEGRDDSLFRRPPGAAITLSAGESAVHSVGFPSFAQQAVRTCLTQAVADSTGILVGMAQSADGTPVARARISVEWNQVRASGDVARITNLGMEAEVDDAGRYVVCNLPGGTRVRVIGRVGAMTTPPVDATIPANIIRRVDVRF